MTTANAFSEPKRMNPRALTVVVLLHGAALTALVLAKGEEFIKPFNRPIVVTPIPEDQPPPPRPQPRQEVPPDSHLTVPPHIVDLPLPTPIPAPPAPPLPTWTGPVVGTGTLPAEEPPAPPPPPPAAPRIEPARAKANLASYVSDADYPAAAIRSEEQGTTRFRLAVGPDGKVRDCTVTGSSGSSALDSATCRIMKARARFQPARDGTGNPTGDTVANAIRWVLPEG